MSILDEFFPRTQGSDGAATIMLEARQGNFSSIANWHEARKQGLSMPKRVRIKSDNLPSAMPRRYRSARYR